MSYQVLARKYRSQTFDEVVGQNHVAQTLKRAIDSGRVAHAFLFCGTRGTGKTSMARILAMALNCQGGKEPTTKPCGKCTSCTAIRSGDDMDVIEIDAASYTGVDNVRDIIANAQFHPSHSRFKIYIIDEVHMLSKSSFNALLKTLEEPPEHVKFILATTEPEKVLPTILSRCQRYDFRNIATREIAEHLRQICKQEKIKADEEALLLIAKAGCGSMRDALSLLDRLLSVGEKQLTVELIEQMLGMPKSQVLFDLAQAIGAGDVKRLLPLADAQIKGGMSPDTLVGGLIDHLRNLLILRACGPDSELVEVPGVTMEELASQASQFEAVTLSQDIAILEELRRSLRSSGAGRALLDATLVRLALAGQFTAVDELLNRVSGGGGGGGSTSSPASRAPALKKNDEVTTRVVAAFSPSPCAQGEGGGEGAFALASLKSQIQEKNPLPHPLPEYRARESESNIAPVSPTDLDGLWRMLLQMLAARSSATAALLGGAKMVGIEDGMAIVRFAHDHEAIVRRFESNGKKDAIREILTQLLKQNVGVRFELDPAPPEPQTGGNAAQPEARAAAMRRSAPPPAEPAATSAPSRITPEMKEALRCDPLVAAVMRHLGGEIVKVE